MTRFRLAILVLWTGLTLPTSAFAVSVALVAPAVRSSHTDEVLSRVRGELSSLGFEVFGVQRTQDELATRDWLERTIEHRGVDAAIDVTSFSVEVWIVQGAPGRYDVTRVAVDIETDNASERLAIRAIEVLRSGLLEAGLVKRDAPLPREVPSRAPERRPAPSMRVGLELGAAALTSLDGVGPAVLPLLRFDLQRRPWLLTATFAGFGTQPRLANDAGSAQVAQQYGVIGASYPLARLGKLTPTVGLSTGFLRTSVEGHAASPRQGHALTQWSLLVDASLASALELTPRYYLTLAMHVQLAEPYVAIRFVDDAIASSGRPNLLVTGTLGGWL